MRIAVEQGTAVIVAGTREEIGAWLGRGPVTVVGVKDPGLAASMRRAQGVDEHGKDRK
jgi:hypothetical protein